jgi:hypothetical protein
VCCADNTIISIQVLCLIGLCCSSQQEDEALKIEQAIEKAIANDKIYKSEIPKPSKNATWLEMRQHEVGLYLVRGENSSFLSVVEE